MILKVICVILSFQMCLSKLFFNLDPKKCAGPVEKLVQLSSDVAPFLLSHKSLSYDDPILIPVKDLIVNRITPCDFDHSYLANFDICQFHKVLHA